jgi:hypothetical protein
MKYIRIVSLRHPVVRRWSLMRRQAGPAGLLELQDDEVALMAKTKPSVNITVIVLSQAA